MSNNKKAKPILFNTPMVRAIMEGRKTQTRRLVKPQPYFKEGWWYYDGTRPKSNKNTGSSMSNVPPDKDILFCIAAKYSAGDILWVRETFTWLHLDNFDPVPIYKAIDDELPELHKWKPSIHMPKSVARIFLEVTDVRIERLQDISEADAIAEGIEVIHMAEPTVPVYKKYNLTEQLGTTNPVLSFKTLWNSINDNWKENPFVWVYTFKRIDKNF